MEECGIELDGGCEIESDGGCGRVRWKSVE